MKKNGLGMNILRVFVLLIMVTAVACAQGETELNSDELFQEMEDSADIFILDVRTSAEFDGPLGHIPGSVLIPLHELKDRLPEMEVIKEKKVVVVCRSGNRSGVATRILREHGFLAFNLTGGMLDWNDYLRKTQQETDTVPDSLR